jgi:hypothetical protein
MALAGRRFGCGRRGFPRAPLFVVAPHTLVLAAKSSGMRAILWLFCPPNASSVAGTAQNEPINAALALPDCRPWFSKAACCKQ